MKTTKTFRLLAVLLALVLAFGAMPALAVEIDSSDYAAWTQSAVDDLYGRLMAAENYEDYIAIVETLSETARTAFFNALTEEQQAALEEHAITLTPASEAFEPIVRFTKVGPLLPAPASGARMMRFAARNGGSSGSDSGIVLNKTAVKDGDGYKITLEAYATGSSTTVSHVDPVDIVLVLDVSGSMDDEMGRTKKIDALKGAVNNFIDSVKTTSPDSRIAIIKFAGDKKGEIGNDTYYNILGKWNYSQIVKKLTKVGDNADSLKAAVNSLEPAGATAADYGMQHAQTIISGAANDGRKKVVIMFTDGEPNHLNGFNKGVANDAISASKSIKAAGATVYTIGIFSGADGTPTDVSKLGNKDTNKYMHLVSSNYKNAMSMSSTGEASYPKDGTSYFLSASSSGDLNNIFTKISQEVGGTEVTLDSTSVIKDIISPSFTLPTGATAADIKLETYACTGKDKDANGDYIWSNNNSTMNATATVGGDKVNVTGFDFSKNWCGTETDAQGKTSYRGNKLVISFTVKPKAGFLGGNDVPTNGEESGIYKNDTADKPDWKFEVPTVNVPIDNVTVTAPDKNVYLWGSLTANDLENGATVKVGDVALDLSKATDTEKPYGLETWQTEYVDITVAVKDKDGKVVTDKISDLAGDTSYTISVTVAPKPTTPTSTQGTPATAKPGTATANINVFKPELTFKDGNVDYQSSIGNTAYTSNGSDKSYAVDNYDSSKTQWIHIDETTGQKMVAGSGDVKMLGTQPNLFLSYEPTSGVENSKVTATGYVPVKVTVQLNDTNGTDVTNKTTFVHQCDVNVAGGCQWAQVGDANGNPAFLLHVINVVGDLTITKTGLNVGTYAGTEDQESAIFTVTSTTDSTKTWTVVVNCAGDAQTGSVTLTNLPAGEYTVTEISGWTWRYTVEGDASKTATVVGGKLDNSVVFNNNQTNDKWLGGDNYANNVFGSGN